MSSAFEHPHRGRGEQANALPIELLVLPTVKAIFKLFQ